MEKEKIKIDKGNIKNFSVTKDIKRFSTKDVSDKTIIEATIHPLPELHIYQVTEQELKNIENASFNKAIFNIGIGTSLSTAISFLICILTTEIKDPYIRATFTGIVVIGLVFFVLFLIFSIRCIMESKQIFRKIRG